jgi:hypothetical protein
MEYHGKLYGHLGGKMYFDTGKTSDDWDALEKRVAELEAENQALRQPPVIGSVCRCKRCNCEIKNDVGDSLCAECWSAN